LVRLCPLRLGLRLGRLAATTDFQKLLPLAALSLINLVD